MFPWLRKTICKRPNVSKNIEIRSKTTLKKDMQQNFQIEKQRKLQILLTSFLTMQLQIQINWTKQESHLMQQPSIKTLY